MSTTINQYNPTKPGLESLGREVTQYLHVSPAEGRFGQMGTNILSAIEGKRNMLAIGGPFGYQTARGTETKDNSSTIAYAAAGLVFQAQATPGDNDDTAFNGAEAFTPAAGMFASCFARLKIADVSEYGLTFGLVTNGSTELFTADPANGILFVKANDAATVVGRVVEDTGTAEDTGTLVTTVDGTEYVIGFQVYWGSTEATTWGHWWVNGTKTVFTADQIAELFDMVAGAPSLSAHLGFRLNGTTQKSATVQWAYAEIDRP